ncbi:two-component sensor histidine kinase [Psychromonas sp. B3M02]|uniref:histidine kinase sensor domain-containing protein n=1 Tax=Psychromonas sp. B3M02 TaxID=2267226 RepID=UPI000DEB1B14|nr:histidine kinase sensor domain-containing protein [Psychromonas sp. B3M02]RBW43590.1 two-component sensor histidine kinase [Psychromonas sp. B3M02]
MKNTLFWRLLASIFFVTVGLFAFINYLTDKTQLEMSFIKTEDQQQLINYAKQAEKLYLQGDQQALQDWITSLQQTEKTWVAIITSQLTPEFGSYVDKKFNEEFRLGRGVDWKVHLYFDQNPVIELPFLDKRTHFLIRLPERMRPGTYLKQIHLFQQVALPLLPLLLLTSLLYRYLMSPLQRLRVATKKFSKGNFNVRVRPNLGKRNDELTDLADAFDQMAENTGALIIQQRQLIADLSHELRTPITRMELVIGSAKQGISQLDLLPRLEKETSEIRSLIEDTLTLAWLENEKPILTGEPFDLIELLEVIVEDAKFEFPNAKITLTSPQCLQLIKCSQRSLSQALENLIRNALKYSPNNKAVVVTVTEHHKNVAISISDQGNGVPDHLIESIFQPFFRVDQSRDKNTDGVGLGLALARRHIEANSGKLNAQNLYPGLQMQIDIPLS